MDVVFLVLRDERALAVFSERGKAVGMVGSHVGHRVAREGAVAFPSVDYEPAPVIPGTKVRVGGPEGAPVWADAPPVVCCVVHETKVLLEDGTYCVYRVRQDVVN